MYIKQQSSLQQQPDRQQSQSDVKNSQKNQYSEQIIHNWIQTQKNMLNSQNLQLFNHQHQKQQKISRNQPIMNAQIIENNFLSIYNNQIQKDKLYPYQNQKPIKQPQISQDQDQQQNLSQNQDQYKSDNLQKYFDLIGQKKDYSISLSKSCNHNFVHKISQNHLHRTQQLQKYIDKNKITVLPHPHIPTPIFVRNINQQAAYQIITLDVCIGKYEKNVKIYNLVEQSCFHSIKPFNSGSFGNIYLWNYLEQQFVVKCITKTNANNNEPYSTGKNKQLFLKQILKQYMIAYIAGVLEVGPKVLNPFGFDIIVSKKCIQFFIQRCSLPQYYLQNVHSKFEQIKQSLFSLHLLNIVHNDIKPENIMYNKKTQKLLFIDFGLSQFLQKSIGHKKITKFIGTYQFSSPQMQKLLFDNESGKIDLYYNDAYSLNMALNKLFQMQKCVQINQLPTQSITTHNLIQNSLNKIFLKFLIWQQNIQKVITLSNIIQLKRKFQLQQQILLFLQKLPFSTQLKHFYHQSIHYSVKQNHKFKKIHDTYVKNISFGDVENLQKNQDYKDFVALYQNLQIMQQQKKSRQQTTFKQRSITKDQKQFLISNPNSDLSEQKILSLYLDFVTFLKRNQNISIQQKSQLSLVMIEKLHISQSFCKHALEDINELLKPIFQCLYHLIKYCLTQPLSKWKKQNFIKILSLLLILGWHIPKQYLQEWRRILCIGKLDDKKILKCYLQFMTLQQISCHSYFQIKNQISLKQLNQMIMAKEGSRNGQNKIIKSIYHHVITRRKRERNTNKNQQKAKLNINQKSDQKIKQRQKNKQNDKQTTKQNSNLNEQLNQKNIQIQIENKKYNINQKQIENQNYIFFNLLVSMFQFDQNPQSRSQIKLDSLLKQIQHLPYSAFKNKSKHIWTKAHLMFWINIHYSRLRVDQQKQLKLLLKIKKLLSNPSNISQIQVYTFQLLSNYNNLKNFPKLNQQLDLIDNTINCSLISQNICLPRRFMQAFMNKKFNTFSRLIKKLQHTRITQLSDINLYRHLTHSYQNINFSLNEYQWCHQYDDLMDLLHSNIQRYVHTFICLFHEFSQLKSNKQVRLAFSQIIRPIFFIRYKESSLKKNCIFSKNKYFYLQVLQSLVNQYGDNQLIVIFVSSKMVALAQDEKYQQACDFIQNQSIIKISQFSLSDYRLTSIVIQFYFIKINLNKNQQDIYLVKTKQLYEQMLKKGAYNYIFNNKTLFIIITRFMNDSQIIFDFFKAMTEHLMTNPSLLNTQLFVSLLRDYLSKSLKKIKPSAQQVISSSKILSSNQQKPISNQYYKFQRANQLFLQIFQYIKAYIRNYRLWQNPYLIVVTYGLSMVSKISPKQLIKLHIMAAKTMCYLNFPVRQYIMNFYYWRINNSQPMRKSLRYNRYLLKKHIKSTFSHYDFESILEITINKTDMPQSIVSKYPGYNLVRNKIYKYYEHKDIIKKKTYLQTDQLESLIQQMSMNSSNDDD